MHGRRYAGQSNGNRGWRKYADQFKDRPVSHLVSFAILHEVTAVIPIFAVYYALEWSGLSIPFPKEVQLEANRRITKAREYFGMTPLDPDSTAMVNMVASYAVVKAAMPLRIAACFLLTPPTAKYCVAPVSRALERLLKRDPRTP
ncbi:hypothetical protein EV182_002889 [Spiromyces aspiralis]|uniref:Uncharacterized protein n=1 Tax=Spiromyces aspiralis TaxID=68401 RepID=A0ACC1HEK9_9FUNG|nr:hypothetical protein EV182_002889 [Spiromyces aspiralis]